MKTTLSAWIVALGMGCGHAITPAQAVPHYAPKPVSGTEAKTLRSALNELERRFGVSILFDSDLIDNRSVTGWNKAFDSIDQALKHLLKDTNLSYRKAGNNFYYIVLKKRGEKTAIPRVPLPLPAPAGGETTPGVASVHASLMKALHPFVRFSTITGTVIDAGSGEPLPGVNVVLKGTSVGTITNATGQFTITVEPENAVLIFSFVGYLPREVPLQGKTNFTVSLQQDVKVLSEAVVVGYGTQERRDVTGALSVIKAKDLDKLPVVSFDQALQGQAPGVFVSTNSGAPGSDVTVRIRGTGTIGNNNPLYVIDGVPTGPESINLFNPRDIESIVVLKDAAAATIYGSRAANGVILVTTKKGKAGETKVNFDGYNGLQSAWRLPNLLGVDQYATLINEAYTNAGRPAPLGRPDTLGPNHDWLRELFRPAVIQNYNLSLSGGSEKAQFAVSGAYFNQEGILPNSNFKRVTFRVNTSNQVRKKWLIGENLTVSYSDGNQIRTNELGGILANAVYKRPFASIYDQDGRLAESASDPNPIAQAYRTDNRRSRLRLFGNVFAEYQFLPALKFRSNVGLDINYSKNKNYTPAFGATLSSLLETADQSYTPLWQNSLSYERKLARHHQLSAVLSVDAQSSRYEYTRVKVDNFVTDDANNRYISAGQNVDIGTIDGYASEWALLSVVSRVNYAYRDRYLMSVSLRRDGTSRFAQGHRWGNFPSVSAAWRISDEPFLANHSLISELKVRGSWGQLGNQEVGDNYATYNTVTTGMKYAFGPGSQTYFEGLGIPTNGRAGAKLASDQLVWETSTQTDVGLDVGLLDNRLQITADYFSRQTRDMLLDQPVSSLSGASTISINAGSIRNRGLELNLTFNQTKGPVQYSAGFNLTRLKNKVLALNENIRYILGPVSGSQGSLLTRTSLGDEVGSFYGYVTDGVFQSKEEVSAHAKQEVGTAPGDIRFKDLNHDGVINAQDQTKIGSPIPDWLVGVNGSLSYKGFDFSLLLQGVQGNEVYNQLAMRSQNSTNLFNKFTGIMDRWTGPGTSQSEPRVHISDPNNNVRVSDRWVEDGSYLRLKNIQFGYSLPNGVARKAGVARARLYVSGQNLLTFTKYSGFDPEMGPSTEFVDGRGADLEIGADKGRYPQARVLLLGLTVGF